MAIYYSYSGSRIPKDTYRYVDCVSLLLKYGADPNLIGYYGWKPLYIATMKERHKFVHILLSYGADPNAIDNGHNGTALHNVSYYGNVKICRSLLIYGANPNIQYNDEDVESEGNTPLHIASKNGYDQLVYTLLRYKANPNIVGGLGNTPLHYTMDDTDVDEFKLKNIKNPYRTECVKYLLKYNANPYIKNNEGKTVLDLAIVIGNVKCIKLILNSIMV
jgi:ankyrin repeat protein